MQKKVFGAKKGFVGAKKMTVIINLQNPVLLHQRSLREIDGTSLMVCVCICVFVLAYWCICNTECVVLHRVEWGWRGGEGEKKVKNECNN